jgi:nucleoside-diphosphate-sugar epimerase
LGVTLDRIDLVVTGAGGRLGRLLHGAFAARPQAGLRVHLCQRDKSAQIQWDMLSGPLPDWPPGAIVLHLAGAVRGDEQSLAANAALVAPLVQACRRNRVRGLFFASTAAVYAPGPAAAREDTPPAPASPYGRAKLAAEAALAAADPGCPVTVLRLANVVGADALLGPRPAGQPITLDPVPGQGGGPLRSWIGPMTLAQVLADLARAMAAGRPLPPVLNLAAAPPLPMADLLDASGLDWAYGPPNPNVVPGATLDSTRLQALVPLPSATAAGLIAELRQVRP